MKGLQGGNGSMFGGFSNFLLGAAVAEMVIKLLEGKSIIPSEEKGIEKFSGKELDLDELMAEKERLEDLIAEAASRQEKAGGRGKSGRAEQAGKK